MRNPLDKRQRRNRTTHAEAIRKILEDARVIDLPTAEYRALLEDVQQEVKTRLE